MEETRYSKYREAYKKASLNYYYNHKEQKKDEKIRKIVDEYIERYNLMLVPKSTID